MIQAVALLVALAVPLAATGLRAPGEDTAAKCSSFDLEAERAQCDEEVCHLRGNVRLSCSKIALWADELDVLLGPERSFAGAEARGGVVLVDNRTVMTCRRLWLAGDRVQGRVDAATIRVKKKPPPLAREQLDGRDEAILHGTIERLTEKSYTIVDGDFTLCDCEGDPPSWRLDATRIDATLDERATIWWPQARVNPFGLALVPITPPMLPLSMPLRNRAAGLLPPSIQFLGMWPTIDVPLFIPIGDSWDVTVTPGMRFDWGSHQWEKGNMTAAQTYGAPRLGLRVRYAPAQGTQGELVAQWTHDAGHWSAKRRQLKAAEYALERARVNEKNARQQCHSAQRACDAGTGSCEDAAAACARVATLTDRVNALRAELPPPFDSDTDPTWDLVERLSLQWDHRSELTDELDFTLSARWLSDDLVPVDFGVTAQETVVSYLPSRAQLLWRRLGWTGSIDASHLLSLTQKRPDGTVDLSNMHGAQRDVLQRSPGVALRLLPRRILGPVHANAEVSWVRTGPWAAHASQPLTAAGSVGGLSLLENFGPFNLGGEVQVDALWLSLGQTENAFSLATIGEVTANTKLAREYGNLVHAVEPFVALRGLRSESKSSTNVVLPMHLEERAGRRGFAQGLVGVRQALFQRSSRTLKPLGSFLLEAPLDFPSRSLGEVHAEVQLKQKLATGGLWAWLDPGRRYDETDFVRSMGGHLGVTLPFVRLAASYLRLGPQSDRFERTLYELMPQPGHEVAVEQGDTRWVHTLGASASISWRNHGSLSYRSAYLLPPPGSTEGIAACGLDDAPDQTYRRSCFVYHQITLGYRSPCDCWGVSSTLSIPALPLQQYRFSLNFEIGGYSIGTVGQQSL